MDVRARTGAIQEAAADAILISLFEGTTDLTGAVARIDQALGGAIGELVQAGDFTGKTGQVAVVYSRGALPAGRVVLTGLGPEAEYGLEVVRLAAANGLRKVKDLPVKRVLNVLVGAGGKDLSVEALAQAVVEGSLLAAYVYPGKSASQEAIGVESLEVWIEDEAVLPDAERGVKAGLAIMAGVTLTRNLVNLPPNFCTPAHLAEAASQVAADTGMRVQVLERGQMQALGMGALLAVAQGSEAPPRFIILEHNASKAGELDSLVLVGKGVTFDTGGYNLKPGDGMATMKTDMAGGAAVIGAMRAIAALDVPLHVVGLVPASDNMISGAAYRPQEVITASNGVTIEIVSTDAEGRMLLADALVFASRFSPAAVVDIATLTGACVTALGAVAAGLFTTDDTLRDRLMAAASATGEKLWPLPLFPEYEKKIESKVADIKNSGGVGSGVGSAAMFLKHFVSYPAWAHIDMAGMAASKQDGSFGPEGATGYGARLLVEFVRSWGR